MDEVKHNQTAIHSSGLDCRSFNGVDTQQSGRKHIDFSETYQIRD